MAGKTAGGKTGLQNVVSVVLTRAYAYDLLNALLNALGLTPYSKKKKKKKKKKKGGGGKKWPSGGGKKPGGGHLAGEMLKHLAGMNHLKSLEAESQAAALSPAVSRPAASSRAANPAARHLAAEKALRRKGKNLSSVERRAPDFGARTFALAETPRWLRQASVSQSMSFTNRRARPVRAF